MSYISDNFRSGGVLLLIGGILFFCFIMSHFINAQGNSYAIFVSIMSLLFAVPFFYAAYTDNREGLICPYFFTIVTTLAFLQSIISALLFLPEPYSFFGVMIESRGFATVLECLFPLIPVSIFLFCIAALPLLEKKFPNAVGVGDIKYLCAAFFLPISNEQICIGLMIGLILSVFWGLVLMHSSRVRLTPFLFFGLSIGYGLSAYL